MLHKPSDASQQNDQQKGTWLSKDRGKSQQNLRALAVQKGDFLKKKTAGAKDAKKEGRDDSTARNKLARVKSAFAGQDPQLRGKTPTKDREIKPEIQRQQGLETADIGAAERAVSKMTVSNRLQEVSRSVGNGNGGDLLTAFAWDCDMGVTKAGNENESGLIFQARKPLLFCRTLVNTKTKLLSMSHECTKGYRGSKKKSRAWGYQERNQNQMLRSTRRVSAM